MTEIQDALENCLQAMEGGASLEHALRRYPQIAEELRPLLVAALMAKDAGRVHVSLDVRRRGRARLMGQVEEYEQRSRAPARRILPTFSRLALTAIVLLALVLTSTGLVSASSGSLPGQQLYPVKRTWESVQLLLVFNPQQRDLLESDFEQERLNETSELLGLRLAAPISFSGILARQSDGEWLVSGIPVSVTSSTSLPGSGLADGMPIRVSGSTRADGVVAAQQVDLLQPGSSLPPLEPSEGTEHHETDSGENPGTVVPPTPSSTPDASKPSPSGTEVEHSSYQYSGVVQSMSGNVWQINGQPVYVESAQINGQVSVGAIVRFQGYYSPDGKLIVTSIDGEPVIATPKHGGGGGAETPSGGGDGGGDSGSGESGGGTESP